MLSCLLSDQVEGKRQNYSADMLSRTMMINPDIQSGDKVGTHLMTDNVVGLEARLYRHTSHA